MLNFTGSSDPHPEWCTITSCIYCNLIQVSMVVREIYVVCIFTVTAHSTFWAVSWNHLTTIYKLRTLFCHLYTPIQHDPPTNSSCHFGWRHVTARETELQMDARQLLCAYCTAMYATSVKLRAVWRTIHTVEHEHNLS